MLTRILVPAPYQAPVEEDKEESGEPKVASIPEVNHTLCLGRLRLPLPKTKEKEKLTSLPPMGKKDRLRRFGGKGS